MIIKALFRVVIWFIKVLIRDFFHRRDPYFLPQWRKVPASHRPILKRDYLIGYFYFQWIWHYTVGNHFVFIHYKKLSFIFPPGRDLSDNLNALGTELSDDEYNIKAMPSDMTFWIIFSKCSWLIIVLMYIFLLKNILYGKWEQMFYSSFISWIRSKCM